MSLCRRFAGLAPAAALALVVAGCPAEEKKPEPKPEPKPAEPEKKPEPKPEPEQPVAATGTSHPECVGPRSAEPAETFEFEGKTFERKGSTLSLKTDDPDDEFVIGQISDVKDFTPENKANVDVILKWFATEGVDAIAVTGDLGESVESISGLLEHLAAAKLPVLAIAGNRECRDHFSDALKATSAKHKNVVNMNTVRVFNTDDASLVSLPGYYNKSYIHCAEGCEYFPEDVEKLEELAKDATAGAKVLISHGPPKQTGEKGLDRIHEEVNVGDPKLAEVLAKGAFPFGLFGNIQEAGGYGSNLAGDKRIEQGQFVDSLYMNPGPIDSVRWQMLDGTESLGMAGLMKIKGKQASYKIYRIRPGEAKVAN
jgi:Icc-related predicted phosphoesterase